MIPAIQGIIPSDVQIRTLFDQSLFVKASIYGVAREALIAAVLTALMILLFLGDWRSTLIIAISIPLSILSSIIILSALGETLNLMTLGGLALAVGILVDDATVTIENIDNYLGARGKEARRDPQGREPDRGAGVRFLALHLHRLRADVRALRRGPVPLRAAGRVGRLRGDGLLFLLPHARADAGHVPDEGRARRGGQEPGGRRAGHERHGRSAGSHDEEENHSFRGSATARRPSRRGSTRTDHEERYGLPKKVQPALQQAAIALHRAVPGR